MDQKLLKTLKGHSSDIWSLVIFKHNGVTYLASGSQGGTIKIWNINDWRLLKTLEGHSGSDLEKVNTAKCT
eukprot:8855397-Ditylum_brightwellii.AAC.1